MIGTEPDIPDFLDEEEEEEEEEEGERQEDDANVDTDDEVYYWACCGCLPEYMCSQLDAGLFDYLMFETQNVSTLHIYESCVSVSLDMVAV